MKTRKINQELMSFQREGSLCNHNTCADGIISNGHSVDSGSPPPLPLKKKHSKEFHMSSMIFLSLGVRVELDVIKKNSSRVAKFF